MRRPRVGAFNAEQAQERARNIALACLFGLITLQIVVLLCAWLWIGKPISEVKDIAAVVLTPTLTLFGTIIGFYFSKR